MTDFSALVPVRNWGLDRVEMSCRSLLRADGVAVEVVLVDYGSDEADALEKLAERLGVVHVRVDADVWSRSRAMNIAARHASGRVLLFADADAVFAPTLPAIVVQMLDEDPNRSLAIQCRDLTSAFRPADLMFSPDFDALEANSNWRPRWGMGLQAMTRATFLEIRGFDDRMSVYGGEDNDISKRVRLAGRRIEWLTDLDTAAYHVWHPSSRAAADADPVTAAMLRQNADIAKNDQSRVRNLSTWRGPDPLVSVVITTFNRAPYIAESIDSVLNQTVQDFEILVIDDGSEDNTAEVVTGYDDSRIRYFPREKASIPAHRNFALAHSRGKFTAIHDDDDLMVPWSLEVRLQALESGYVGSYGAAYNFDDRTAAMQLLPGREATLVNLLHGGKVFLHATVLIETDALRTIGYDESFRSGSDYNLAARILRAGYRMKHSHDVVLLRRVHSGQVTALDEAIQHGSSYATSFSVRAQWCDQSRSLSLKKSRESAVIDLGPEANLMQRVLPYLPNHLVMRHGLFPVEPDVAGQVFRGVLWQGGNQSDVWFVPQLQTSEWAALQGNSTSEPVHLGASLRVDCASPRQQLIDVVTGLGSSRVITLASEHPDNGFVIGADLSPDELAQVVAASTGSGMVLGTSDSYRIRDYAAAIVNGDTW